MICDCSGHINPPSIHKHYKKMWNLWAVQRLIETAKYGRNDTIKLRISINDN